MNQHITEDELWNLFKESKKLFQEKILPESLQILNKCENCDCEEFCENSDKETYFIICCKCGLERFGTIDSLPLCKTRIHGRTMYDPLERFRYWITLAEGCGKIPKILEKQIEKIETVEELKTFLLKKENRKYRKLYGTILKKWDEDLVQPLTSCQKQSLEINFSHVLRIHKQKNEKNEKTGRKKSLPHYTFLIQFFLKKIDREDLALNFLPMKCSKIHSQYLAKINDLF